MDVKMAIRANISFNGWNVEIYYKICPTEINYLLRSEIMRHFVESSLKKPLQQI